MRVGIATWANVLNHGAVLQAIASKRVLEQLGHEVSFVAFQAETKGYFPPQKNATSMLPWNIISRRFFTKKKIDTFSNFRAKHIELKQNSVDAWDAVMIGSDEVFSQEGGFNPALFGLGYSCPVFSYAASCGPTTEEKFKKSACVDQAINGLINMKGIGVRDKNTYDIVKKLTGKEPVVNIDPVLLYGFRQEISTMTNQIRSNIGLYAYTFRWDERDEINMVKRYARQSNCEVHSLGFHHGWCSKNIVSNPIGILGEFAAHKLVVTDTFHGTIMSVITHTPFCVMVRNESPKLISLLKTLGVEDRRITKDRSIEQIARTEIDFVAIEKRLDAMRAESMHYLSSMLEECEVEK